jgi:hypothetical protein
MTKGIEFAGLSLTPGLGPVLRGTRNQAVLTALSRARV